MHKKIVLNILLVFYLYTLTFGIFLNTTFRAPTPLLFALPAVFLFGRLKNTGFLYFRECLVFLFATMFYYLIGQALIKEFFVNLITIVFCALFFNYVIRDNAKLLNKAIFIVMAFLLLSSVVMVLNHMYRAPIDSLRSRLIGGEVFQSPSGISGTIFTFGYHIAALSTFAVIYVLAFKKNLIIQTATIITCLVFIYLGLQRSVLVVFGISLVIFLLFFYKSKAILILASLAILGGGLLIYSSQQSSGKQYDNILAKNERKANEGRSDLVTENLKIISNYPYGLIFYGKNWHDIIKNNPVYVNGIASHNAYLMFFTYLGPFLGLFFLIMLYRKIIGVFLGAIKHIEVKENAMLVCLSFAFISVSLNSLFHNDCLITTDGPTVFLYFATLHFYNINGIKKKSSEAMKPATRVSSDLIIA